MSFDLAQSNLASQFDDNDILIVGENLTIALDLLNNPGIEWTNYSVKLDASENWQRMQNQFMPKLTSRETEILQLISKEFTTEEIAEKLFISIKTVESHKSNLFQKLGVKNSAGLIRAAFEKGFI